MAERSASLAAKPAAASLTHGTLLQRKCACGAHGHGHAECAQCAAKHRGLQRKLAIGASNDPLEVEADRVADMVVTTPTFGGNVPLRVQRASSSGGGARDTAPASAERALATPGMPLDAAARDGMERRFGHDFSRVRIHTDAAASLSARDMDAQAYTAGSHIVFAEGSYSPTTKAGARLLAHELTHVLQQGSGDGPLRRFVNCTPPRLSGEQCPPREADEVRRARVGDMLFLDYRDAVENVSGALVANFDIGKAALKPNLAKTIFWKQFLARIAKNKSHWELIGLTDCEGEEKRNSPLRKQRAQSVFDALPAPVKPQIDSVEGAVAGDCVRDNATPVDRTLNRSVLFKLTNYVADLSAEANEVPATPTPDVGTKDCPDADKRHKLALAFRFAKMMVDKAIALIDRMKPGTPEAQLLVKYFGTDALASKGEIRRTYRLLQRDWNPDLTLRCETADDRDKTQTIMGQSVVSEGDCHSGTEGFTGVVPLITGGHVGSLLICDSAFTTNVLPETDLPETILHEISHALQWTFDKGYCSRSSGCALSTEEAIHNGDSYSGFAGEALSTWGPE